MTTDPPDATRFRAVYEANFEPILRYAVRRVAVPEDAADVVAETFLTAWRRQGDVPGGAQARLWLFGVARRVLANHARGEVRRHRLGERLRLELSRVPADTDGALDVRAALARLGDLDREVLTLSVWEGLRPSEIAEVLALAPGAVRTRLSRARAHLRDELADAWSGDGRPAAGHVEAVPTGSPPKEPR